MLKTPLRGMVLVIEHLEIDPCLVLGSWFLIIDHCVSGWVSLRDPDSELSGLACFIVARFSTGQPILPADPWHPAKVKTHFAF
jgi:hypothetical protein